MNKSLFFFLLMGIPWLAFPQIPNSDFEEWPDSLDASSHDGDLAAIGIHEVLRGVPAGWELSHQPFGVCQVKDPCTGEFSLLLFSWYHGVETGIKSTFPINTRPAVFKGCYKYRLQDSLLQDANCLVEIIFWSEQDTLAISRYNFDTTLVYRTFEVPLQYRNENTPDSVSVRFFVDAPNSVNYPADGFLYIDQLQWGDVVTKVGNANPEDTFEIYPNPFHRYLNINCHRKGRYFFELYSLQGQLIDKGPLAPAGDTLDLSILATGIYFLNITGKDSQSMVYKFMKI